MKCKHCEQGMIPMGYYPATYVTRDMAADAGDLSLEGEIYTPEGWAWDICSCCNGEWEICENCTKETDEANK